VQIDLVQTTTRDGLRLDGALRRPSPGGSRAIPIDVFCLIHGTGGNFYGSSLFDVLADRLLQLGCGVLRVNTRGHDGISTAVTAQGGKRQGAAYEVVDDCRHDVAAWIDWCLLNVGPRVGLVGHSLGAVKAIYALARDPALATSCLIALSPPRLSYSFFCTAPEAAEFLETYRLAEDHAANGRGATLLDVQLPLPFAITAGGYVEKYGPEERYNLLPLLGGVSCPMLITFGSIEVEKNMAFSGLPKAVQGAVQRKENISIRNLPGGDHFYTGVRSELLAEIETWLRGVSFE
jgi:pimeloyl-ACP methyl ester carboxylesterase